MNSSSKDTEKEEYRNISEAAAAGGGGEVKRGELLELTLGFVSASSKAIMQGWSPLSACESSSSPSFQSQGQELALGLKLGFENQINHSSSTMLHASNSSSPSSNLTQVHVLSWPPVPSAGHQYCSERPHPGLWFSLRSIINRDGEVLPQIPKAYIRVKNENVTVFMVKTYLVRKLGLSNESQVEISCMGQKLVHSQTMKNVRDEIWLPKLIEFLNSNPALVQNSNITSVHRLMSLDYGKSCLSS